MEPALSNCSLQVEDGGTIEEKVKQQQAREQNAIVWWGWETDDQWEQQWTQIYGDTLQVKHMFYSKRKCLIG